MSTTTPFTDQQLTGLRKVSKQLRKDSPGNSAIVALTTTITTLLDMLDSAKIQIEEGWRTDTPPLGCIIELEWDGEREICCGTEADEKDDLPVWIGDSTRFRVSPEKITRWRFVIVPKEMRETYYAEIIEY